MMNIEWLQLDHMILSELKMNEEGIKHLKEIYGSRASFIVIGNNDNLGISLKPPTIIPSTGIVIQSVERDREERLAEMRDMIKKKKMSKLGQDGKPMNKRQLAKEKKQNYKR